MAMNAQIVHEDGTPFTEAELNSSGCSDCDRLSAPELARRAERQAAEEAARQAQHPVVVRKRSVVVSYDDAMATQDSNRATESYQHSFAPIPVRCPKHVLR
jgi:hypothetical protein